MFSWPSVQVRLTVGPSRETSSAMDKQTQKQKRSRKSAPKSRQGCITCKTRHVKCDETRPICKRCTKAGRKCEGYAKDPDDEANEHTVPAAAVVNATTSSSSTLIPSSSKSDSRDLPPTQSRGKTALVPSASNPAGLSVRINTSNPQEIRFLEYFYTRTAPAISGFFDASFYNRLLLQAGQYEPAIRHAMMAVGAMHEHFEFTVVPALEGRRQPVATTEKPAFALQQYNKAISAISKQLSNGPGSMESVLMCCLLFVCLECLRGDSPAAGTHLKSGGDIIANLQSQKQKRISPPSSPEPSSQNGSSEAQTSSSEQSKFIETYLVPIFERMSTHVSGAAKLSSSDFTPMANSELGGDDPLITGFENLDDARKSVMRLGYLATGFAKSVAQPKFADEITPDQLRAVVGLQRKLQLWDDSMKNLVERIGVSRRAVVLQVQHRIFKILALTCLAQEQSSNDCLTDDFEAGINLAQLLLDQSGTGIPLQEDEQDLHAFSLEEGVSPALFFFASRCRVPSLRRRAIETLWKGPRRQGIWNSVLLAKVAERIIELEENFQPPHLGIVPLQAGAAPQLDEMFTANIDPALINLPMTPESIESAGSPPLLNLDPTVVTALDPLPFETLPIENSRIHLADIKESTDGTPHQHAVTFFRKTSGIDKEWDVWTEQIYI